VTRQFSGLLSLAPEVERALLRSEPVVALESSLIAHGLPSPAGVEVAVRCEQRVRDSGAIPATIAVMDGAVHVGLTEQQLERLQNDPGIRKVGPRDLASCAISGRVGATTVGGTLAVCRLAGIHFMATGGIGGVHRGWERTRDVSADLHEIAAAAVCVVCSGAKSLLDVAATLETLESAGVPVIGYRSDSFPLFYEPSSRHLLADRADDPVTVAAIVATHWGFARTTGVIVAQPVASEAGLAGAELEPLIERTLADAAKAGVVGGALTPWVLARLHEATGGRTLTANRRLVEDNAGLAAEIAAAYYAQ
jgi:pseudouridylate synthase